MKRIFAAAVLTTGLLLSSLSAQAVSTGTYTLSNHPDGNQNPPAYGLRLDGLLTGSSNEEYTFDFDHALSNMTLEYTENGTKTIVISGQAFGGEDDNTTPGGAYVGGTTALWDIKFEYNLGVSQPGGEGGLDDVVVTANHLNFGILSSALGTFSLRDHADGDGISFNFGDEGGLGHRGFDGISGWGWLDHWEQIKCITSNETSCNQDFTHIYSSDWLFTANPVPVPAAVWLFGTGLVALVAVARRRV